MNNAKRGKLRGKVCLVTGGGRGLGRAIALSFAREGASAVVVASRTSREVTAVAREIARTGTASLGISVDVSKPESVAQMFRKVESRFGTVDVLVNCAGVISPITPVAESDAEEWLSTVGVVLGGTYLCCRRALPRMIAQHWGRIVNIAGSGEGPDPNFTAYASSKSAVVRFTESLAAEVGKYNVLVNAIAPGTMMTRMIKEIEAAGKAAGKKEVERIRRVKKRGGVPPELPARLAVFLASNPPKWLNGKLVSAGHDSWSSWQHGDFGKRNRIMYTMRRVDKRLIDMF